MGESGFDEQGASDGQRTIVVDCNGNRTQESGRGVQITHLECTLLAWTVCWLLAAG